MLWWYQIQTSSLASERAGASQEFMAQELKTSPCHHPRQLSTDGEVGCFPSLVNNPFLCADWFALCCLIFFFSMLLLAERSSLLTTSLSSFGIELNIEWQFNTSSSKSCWPLVLWQIISSVCVYKNILITLLLKTSLREIIISAQKHAIMIFLLLGGLRTELSSCL